MSDLFRGARAAVEASCDRWWILSAKHGLLDPEAVIEPYDQTLVGTSRQHRRTWSRRVVDQLRAHLGEFTSVVFEVHAGKDYYDFGLVRGLQEGGAEVVLPTEGMRLGEKLRFYRTQGRGSAGALPQASQYPQGTRRPTHQPRSPSQEGESDVAAPSGRYRFRPLYEHLRGLASSRWDARFEQVEQVLGGRLPASARRHAAWWSSETRSHSHARAWVAAGYRTSQLDLPAERVTFVRQSEQ